MQANTHEIGQHNDTYKVADPFGLDKHVLLSCVGEGGFLTQEYSIIDRVVVHPFSDIVIESAVFSLPVPYPGILLPF